MLLQSLSIIEVFDISFIEVQHENLNAVTHAPSDEEVTCVGDVHLQNLNLIFNFWTQFDLIYNILLKSIDDNQISIHININEIRPVKEMTSNLQMFITFNFDILSEVVPMNETALVLFSTVSCE